MRGNNEEGLLVNLDTVITDKVLGDYYEALVKFHTKHGEGFPKGEIRRGALQSPCSRNAWYYNFFEGRPTLSGITNMVFGTLFHEIPIYKCHELKEVWEGVRLDADEWNPDFHIFLEKKTRDSPARGEHVEPFTGHVVQVEHGRAMLQELGYDILWSGLLYVYKDGSRAKVCYVSERRSREEVLKEIRGRRDILIEYIDRKELPPRTPCWQCDYCEFPILCYQNRTGFEGLGELLTQL